MEKLLNQLDTWVVMLSGATRRRWNDLSDKNRCKAIRVLSEMACRCNRQRLYDVDYQNVMNQLEGC